ncbi:DUF1963 domain-containing protein [bacterium]|jgi:uncharacterized protein YwqG|nr:DUF1963 domain-containing protein [bacterium]
MNSQMRADFEALIEKHSLTKFRDHLLSQAKTAAALIPGRKSVEALRPSQSKLGGKPDAPSNFIWPTKDEKPLSFIAQINLSDVPAIEGSQLPNSGLLSFFYNNEVWGFDPKDKGGFQVFYFENEIDHLKAHQPPPAKTEKKLFGMFSKSVAVLEYSSCPLTAELTLTLPYELKGIALSEEETEKYCELLEAIGGHHRLLGHAEPIQNEMELECELVTNGLYCGDSTGYHDPRAKKLEKSSDTWNLLLQIDSDDEAEMMWGDAGRLYFWIRAEDLANRQFSNCWMISQCY